MRFIPFGLSFAAGLIMTCGVMVSLIDRASAGGIPTLNAKNPVPAISGPTTADLPVNVWTGEGIQLGGILFPHFHAAAVFGQSTSDIASLANGHHDPQREATLQSFEPGLSLRAGNHLRGFATYSGSTDEDGKFDGDWEEAFLKLVDLPGNLELRAGRFLNRFGFQNASHQHSWDFVNQQLLNGRILQEGEIVTEGAEVTWNLPTPFRSAFSFSYGAAPSHEDEHDHHEDEDDHDEDEDDHDEDHHDDGEEGFEGEEARFVDEFFSAHWIARFDSNDFHQHALTLSSAWGDNGFGRTTELYGIGYEYLWRENGYEPGGRTLRVTNEISYRRFGAASEDQKTRKNLEDIGISSLITYGFNDHLTTGFRAGFVSGIDEAELDERWRISPNLTFSLNSKRTLFARLQYDYDHSSDSGSEHSAWLQFGFNWGGPEVR